MTIPKLNQQLINALLRTFMQIASTRGNKWIKEMSWDAAEMLVRSGLGEGWSINELASVINSHFEAEGSLSIGLTDSYSLNYSKEFKNFFSAMFDADPVKPAEEQPFTRSPYDPTWIIAKREGSVWVKTLETAESWGMADWMRQRYANMYPDREYVVLTHRRFAELTVPKDEGQFEVVDGMGTWKCTCNNLRSAVVDAISRALDTKSRFYVTDAGSKRLYRADPDGDYTKL